MNFGPQHLPEHSDLVHSGCRSSIIFGTTKNPSTDSGALATADSPERDVFTSSGRNTLACPSTVAVGSTPAVLYCFNVSTCVRIWLNCFANADFSTSVNASRARFATFSTSCCVISTLLFPALSSTMFVQNGLQQGRREKDDRELCREPFSTSDLFYCYALGQVSRLIHIRTAQHGDMVRQELQWNRK